MGELNYQSWIYIKLNQYVEKYQLFHYDKTEQLKWTKSE